MATEATSPQAKIGSRLVETTGSFVCPNDQTIEFYPLSSDPDFKVVFDVEYDENSKGSQTKYQPIDDGLRVTLIKKWEEGNRTSLSNPTSVFKTNKFTFFLYYAYETIGTREKHSGTLVYTIVKEAI